MNPYPIDTARDTDLRLSSQALQRAAQRARELARQTGTAIVVSYQGVLETIRPGMDDGSAPAPAANHPPSQ